MNKKKIGAIDFENPIRSVRRFQKIPHNATLLLFGMPDTCNGSYIEWLSIKIRETRTKKIKIYFKNWM